MASNALTTSPQQQIATLRSMLDKSKEQIAAALPRHLTPERMIRVALTAIQRTPKLQQCSAGSIIGSVIIASQLGLEPDGILGRGYLIPRWNSKTKQMEASFMAGYLGLIELAMRSGKVSWISAEIVYHGEKFDIVYGLDRNLIHKPDMDNPLRGEFDEQTKELVNLRGAYAVVKYKDGETDFEYMPLSKLQQLRNFSQSKDSEYSPWNTPLGIEDMYRKCPIRKLAKRCPLSPEFQKAAQLEELAEAGISQGVEFEIDPLSEAATIATNSRVDAIAAKYSESQESGHSAENEDQDAESPSRPEQNLFANLKAAAQAKANQNGEPVAFDYEGASVTVDPQPAQESAQTQAPSQDGQQASTSIRRERHTRGRQPQGSNITQGAPLDFERDKA